MWRKRPFFLTDCDDPHAFLLFPSLHSCITWWRPVCKQTIWKLPKRCSHIYIQTFIHSIVITSVLGLQNTGSRLNAHQWGASLIKTQHNYTMNHYAAVKKDEICVLTNNNLGYFRWKKYGPEEWMKFPYLKRKVKGWPKCSLRSNTYRHRLS